MADATLAVNKREGTEAVQDTPEAEVRTSVKCRYGFGPQELRIACTSLVLISFTILLIAITTNNWMGDGKMSVGLWYACLRPLCARTPEYIHPGTAVLKVVHTMMFVAVFFALGAIIILSVSFFQPRIKSTSLAMLAGIASIVAAVFIIVGMSVYMSGSQHEKAPVRIEWSYYAGWVACGLFLVAGLITLVICRTEPQVSQEPQDSQVSQESPPQ